jgi:hypothetical protein
MLSIKKAFYKQFLNSILPPGSPSVIHGVRHVMLYQEVDETALQEDICAICWVNLSKND